MEVKHKDRVEDSHLQPRRDNPRRGLPRRLAHMFNTPLVLTSRQQMRHVRPSIHTGGKVIKES